MSESALKSGYKTTEFWLCVVAWVVALLLDSGILIEATVIKEGFATLGAALASIGYAYSRGRLKEPLALGKKGWQTSEFWLTALGMVSGAVLDAGVLDQGGIAAGGLGTVSAGLVAAGYAYARSKEKEQPK